MSKLPNASAIGSLIYTMVCRRLDIVNAVGVVSRESSQADFEVSKRLIRHIPMLHRSRFNVDFDSRKSTTSFVYTLGGTIVFWASKLQKHYCSFHYKSWICSRD
jgi:hypothetical protein